MRHFSVTAHLRRQDGSESELNDEDVAALEQLRAFEGEVVFEVRDQDGNRSWDGPFETRQEADEHARVRNALEELEPSDTNSDDGVLDVAFDEILADRTLLDAAARAVTLSQDCDYLGAIDKLQGWAHNADPDGPQTLRKAIDFSPVALDDFASDLDEIRARGQLRAEAEAAADAPGEELDDQGRVLLGDPDERARRMTDPYEFERAYQRELDASGALGSDEGREQYRQQYRVLLDSGIDPVATIERTRREAAGSRQVVDQERRSASREADERKRRARQRALNERISDARTELDRL